jgi:hypothetical protein
MQSHPHRPSPGDVAAELSSLNVVMGILTMTFFPFALPALLLALPLVLVALPLLVLGGLGYLLVRALRWASGVASSALRRDGDRPGAAGEHAHELEAERRHYQLT